MVVDCHYHFTPESIPEETLLAHMDSAGIDKVAIMPSFCGPIGEPPSLFTALMRFTLRHSSLRPFTKKSITRFTDQGHVRLPTGAVAIYPVPDNRQVFETVDHYPERFYGWCMVNPAGSQDPLRGYDLWKDHPGCVGVKAHPFWHRFAVKELLAVCHRVAQKKAVLIIHLGFDNHGDILSLADALPELKIIIAHAAFPCYNDTWKLIRNRPNIRVDLSATSYVNEKIMIDVSSFLGIERCLFGTDGPFGSHQHHEGFDMAMILRTIKRVFPDTGHQRLLLGENFLEFINPGCVGTP